jgi:large subunit ribosomal protein L17
MRHQVRGRKLNRTASHRKALLRNLATSLFEYKKVNTTLAKAKELRPYAEHLITKAKIALQNEKSGLLPEGQKVDIHNRRLVGKVITNKAVLQELFDTIAPLVEERHGGYCRITKIGNRRGDAGKSAIIELVDWSAPQDGTVSLKARKKTLAKRDEAKKARAAKKAKKAEEAAEELETEETAEVDEKVLEEQPIQEADETITAENEDETIADEELDSSEDEVEESNEDSVEETGTPTKDIAGEKGKDKKGNEEEEKKV